MSHNISFEKFWIVGAGTIGQEYAKILMSMQIEFTAIGRGKESANDFEKNTGHKALTGGIVSIIDKTTIVPSFVIVAVNVEFTATITKLLINLGVKNILIEKPGGINNNEIKSIYDLAKSNNTNAFIAYNRRYLSSTLKAMEIIEKDGGVDSFSFEFTEWAHVIEKTSHPDYIKEILFLSNSTHVVDLAFFMGGKPMKMSSYVKGRLPWYSKASAFSGAGITDKNALFNYNANWSAPGRWSVEVLTKKHRLLFKPLEKLQIQGIGSLDFDFVDLADELDIIYKPGFYKQVEAFYTGNLSRYLKTIEEQYCDLSFYNKIEGLI